MKNLTVNAKRAAVFTQRQFFSCILGILALLGGFVNGLLGTGGGILLLYALHFANTHSPDASSTFDTKDAFAAVLLCTLPLSILSVLLYFHSRGWDALPVADSAPYLLGAVFGGGFGAFCLEHLKPKAIKLLFALLLLFSGWRMAFS